MNNEVAFEIGGRFSNRIGQYEVSEINGDRLHTYCEKDGIEANLVMEIKKLFVKFANQDRIINELLVIYPTTVVLGEIFHKKPIYEIDEKTLQTLLEANPDIWMR